MTAHVAEAADIPADIVSFLEKCREMAQDALAGTEEDDLPKWQYATESITAWLNYLRLYKMATYRLGDLPFFPVIVDGSLHSEVTGQASRLVSGLRGRSYSTVVRVASQELDGLLGEHLRRSLLALDTNAERSDHVEATVRQLRQAQAELDQHKASARELWAVAIAEDAAEAAQSAAINAQRAAGIAGDARMSSFYGKLALTEQKAADNFRRLTVTMVFTVAVGTLAFILGPGLGWPWLDIPAGDYVHLVQRGVFVAGIFGLAGYFARQAQQHRSMANWANALAVQLQTFEAYISPVESNEVRDELRRTFASRVFGDHPAMRGEPAVTPSAAAMDAAVGWAAKLAGGGK